ncbi:hypothetical protein JCM24511_04619 [Saitozyma sp. JCM 24511]|nr:hypothetical protein JCM24511_04619 [Saitozyma sp. JCM 24511]
MWNRTLASISTAVSRRLSRSQVEGLGGNDPASGGTAGAAGSGDMEMNDTIKRPTRLSKLTQRLEESYRAFGVTVSRFASADGSQLGAKFEISTAETSSSSDCRLGFGLGLMNALKTHDLVHAQTFIPITASEGRAAFALATPSDDPQLNSAILLDRNGGDPAQVKMDVAYFASLRSGLEHTGSEMVITPTGVFFRVFREGRGGESVATAIERFRLLEGITGSE